MSEDVPTYGEAAMNAMNAEAQAVVALIEDVRKMRKLSADLGAIGPALAAETQRLNTQIARSLRRQRRVFQSVLDRGEGTAEDRTVAAEMIALIIGAQVN